MDTKKKKFKLTEEQKDNIKAGLAIGGGALLMFGFGYLCGFGGGAAWNDRQIGKGLEECFKEDPTLKQHMVDTTMKVQAKMLMKS